MILYVDDFMLGNDDSEGIRKCIEKCRQIPGEKTVIFANRVYQIEEAILIPSDTTVILDGSSIKQKDYVYDNIFRGDNLVIDPKDPYGWPLEVKELKNVKIIGKNNAQLIGCDRSARGYHPVLQREEDKVGDFWGWRTLQISFSRCEHFEIADISCSQTKCWAMSFDNCSYGYIHNVTVHSNVKNGDGIDFRSGCHHCKVDGVYGFTSDDTVACSALASTEVPTYQRSNYLYPMEPGRKNSVERGCNLDIHDIEINNIMTGGHMHGVICLAIRGNQVYNISIKNVKETSEGSRKAAVEIYSRAQYGTGYREGDIHDITIDTVEANISKYAVLCSVKPVNFDIKNIVQNAPDKECIGKNY